MKRISLLVLLATLGISSAACGGGAGGPEGAGGYGSPAYDTNFPLPASVSNFTETGDDAINFRTNMSLEDTLAFYRAAFAKAGLTERTINTAVSETTFNLVFDGDSSGKAIVVQGVDLGGGTTNVNIRYEDV
ncbi:MAG: hypothetical protein V1755_14260 [Chloroflexota bacterium]